MNKLVKIIARVLGGFLGIVVLLSPAVSQAQSILPQIADGGGWRTAIVLTNSTTAAALVSLNFFKDTTGGATTTWLPPFNETSSTQNISIPASGTTFLHTPGTATALTQGWAQLTGSDGVTAYALYTYLGQGGRPDQDGTSEAVAASSRILLPFDNTSGSATSMAIVNPNAFSETVSVNIKTDQGIISQTSLPPLPPGGQMAFVTGAQLPSTAGQRGLAEFYVQNGTISVAAFRFNPTLALTSSPSFLETGPPIIGSAGIFNPPFTTLTLATTFTPGGAQSGTIIVTITPATDGTYTAVISGNSGAIPIGGTLTRGVVSNQGQMLSFNGNGSGVFSNIITGSLVVSITQKGYSPNGSYATGAVVGSLGVTLNGTGGSANLTGSLVGTYVQNF